MKPLLSEFITNQRLDAVQPFLSGNILDIGCGYTRIPPLLKPDQTYVGIDHDPLALQWNSVHYPHFNFQQYNLENDIIRDLHGFDTILMLAVLEHLDNPNNIFKQIKDFLAPNGVMILTTPTQFGGIIHTFGSYLGLFYKEAREDHKRFYGSDSLGKLFQENRLKLCRYATFLCYSNQIAVCSLN